MLPDFFQLSIIYAAHISWPHSWMSQPSQKLALSTQLNQTSNHQWPQHLNTSWGAAGRSWCTLWLGLRDGRSARRAFSEMRGWLFFGGRPLGVVVFWGKFGDEIGEKMGCHVRICIFFESGGNKFWWVEMKKCKTIYRIVYIHMFFVGGIGAHVV